MGMVPLTSEAAAGREALWSHPELFEDIRSTSKTKCLSFTDCLAVRLCDWSDSLEQLRQLLHEDCGIEMQLKIGYFVIHI